MLIHSLDLSGGNDIEPSDIGNKNVTSVTKRNCVDNIRSYSENRPRGIRGIWGYFGVISGYLGALEKDIWKFSMPRVRVAMVAVNRRKTLTSPDAEEQRAGSPKEAPMEPPKKQENQTTKN